ncbi:hypothetical protein [Streptomyces sp. DH10]|nr:hypothetical protein [Streptomyces sp. DH10]MDG9709647.1 hypothetical protein [Streptomyces sp. DH10]
MQDGGTLAPPTSTRPTPWSTWPRTIRTVDDREFRLILRAMEESAYGEAA